MSKTIPLTQGKYAIVDDEDCAWLSQYKWYAHRPGNSFYAVRHSKKSEGKNRRMILMHREILRCPRGKQTDHRDGNGLDNRRVNLRICSHQENLYNRRKHKQMTSRYKGVSWHKRDKSWRAQIRDRGKVTHLGCFDNEEDAAQSYNRKATELFKDFAKLNRINSG